MCTENLREFLILPLENTGELTYVDMVQLTKNTCQAQTLDHWIEFPASTSCISSTNNANGFCNVSTNFFPKSF